MILVEVALGWPAPPKAQIAIIFACGRPQQTDVGRDRSGHAGAVRIWGGRTAAGVEPADDSAGEIRLVGVDFRIDHRNDDIVPLADPVRVGEMELFYDVLRRIAQSEIGIVLILGQAIDVIRLHRCIEPSGLDNADHLAHGSPIGDAEGVNSAAQHGDGLLRQNGKSETLGYAVDLLRRYGGGDLEHHFVRRKPRFANWRHARTGRQRNDRQVNEPRVGRGAVAALPPVGEAAHVQPRHCHPASQRDCGIAPLRTAVLCRRRR